MQLQLFDEVEKPIKKQISNLVGNIEQKKDDHFCSHNVIKEKGVYFLRTCIGRAKASKKYKEFLFYIKLEIDFKKGKTTLSNAVRTAYLYKLQSEK